MPTWNDLAAFAKDLKGFEVELTDVEAAKITKAQALEAQRIANAQAARSLGGDRAFSGWNRGRPIPLDTLVRGISDNGHIVTPKRASAGPWTVAEFGRNQGNAAGFAGPSINRTTGVTSRTKKGNISRRRMKARRWNGVTAGKGTATKAEAEMNRRLPPIVDKAVTRIARKRFDVTR